MSAIFGRLNFDERPVSSAELDSMQQPMAYWGPDGDGTWFDGHVGLGNLRFINTPEAVGDSMPWRCPESGDVITASVRLDNREELLAALSVPHAERGSIPDGRILLQAYHHWGHQCVDRLLGDWVFAIWNARERELFIARDHHGNTGLYYYADPRFLVFSSSLKGLLALPEVPQRPNPLAIAQILTAWAAQGEPTCYEGILRLPPAHGMTVTSTGIKVERYWYLEHTPDLHLSTDQEYLEAFLEVFAEAVRCRLRGIAPVGVTLSGGLDSSSVAAMAARELEKTGQRLAAYSSVPIVDTQALVGDGLFGDETPFIEATAEFVGNIDLNYIHASQVSPLEGIERGLSIHDQPMHAAGNMAWLTELLAKANSEGLGAVLTGQVGNGTISWDGGGQPSPLEDLLRLRWGTGGRKLRAWQERYGRSLLSAVRSQIVRPLLAPMRQRLHWAEDPMEAWRNYSAINPEFAQELDLTQQMARAGHDPMFHPIRDAHEARAYLIAPGAAIVGHIYHEFGATYGLEIRDPTADPRVMSFCWSIPRSQFVREDRNRLLIRRAMEGYLPDKVRWNRQKGVQAADVAKRVVDHRSDIDGALATVERSELARDYLDLPRMRGVFEAVQHGIDRKNNAACVSVLLRGLMVGLFLVRFD